MYSCCELNTEPTVMAVKCNWHPISPPHVRGLFISQVDGYVASNVAI